MVLMYEKEFEITSIDVNKNMELRLSRMFQIFQVMGMEHISEIGLGEDKTLARGLLWILSKQRTEIERMPRHSETVVFKTWVGTTAHMLFPRYYQIETTEGEVLVRSSAMWSLLDANTRSLASDLDEEFRIEGELTGEEISMAANPRAASTDSCEDFVVPFSYIDMNGHMNNTKYLDKAEDIIPAPSKGLSPKLVLEKFATEVMEGATVSAKWCYTPDEGATEERPTGKYYVSYESGDTVHMKLQIEY
ncbi:MAG: hypothetical protein HUJ65_05210 [Oscillospiraceae bacterium]|nr:hypothetical protein [Oscillospiraceae bacterium]